jgi:hypothetical protein
VHVFVSQCAVEKLHQRLDHDVERIDAALTTDTTGNDHAAANHDVLLENTDEDDED